MAIQELDFQIEEDLNIADGDLDVSNNDNIDIFYNISSYRGSFKREPLFGVGIYDFILSPLAQVGRELRKSISSGLNRDGFRLLSLSSDNSETENQSISINAEKIDIITRNKPAITITSQTDISSKDVVAKQGQTIFDICLQEYGSLEYLSVILSDNDLTINNQIYQGQVIKVYPTGRGDQRVKDNYSLTDYYPSSGWEGVIV